MKSDKDINNNINKEKLLKMELNKDNDIKYLTVCLDENKDIILELKKEILSLQNKIKILENNALLSERKIRDKNLILENNILELKKKYEDSQIKRLILEDNCRRLRKVISNKKINLVNSKEESSSSKKEMRFVDINNIKGSKLDIDASDLKSFEKSRVISISKR